MLSIVFSIIIMLNVIMLSVVKLNVIMLSVVMLSDLAPKMCFQGCNFFLSTTLLTIS
jgi:hypothetical protein